MSRRLYLIAFAALLALPVRSALADDEPCAREAATVAAMKTRDPALRSPSEPEAKAHMELAKRAYGVGDYAKAIDEYIAAGLETNSTLVLYNLAQTHRAAKDYEKAIRQYRLFVDRGRPGPEVTALVTCLIATMEAEMKHAASTAPPTGPEPDEAGEGASSSEGSTLSSEPQREESVTVAPVTSTPSSWTPRRKLAVAVGVAGLGAVGIGAGLGISTESLKDDAASMCAAGCSADDADEANRLVAMAHDRALGANIAFGVGAAALIGAAVLWITGGPDDHEDSSAVTAVVPTLSPSYAGFSFARSF